MQAEDDMVVAEVIEGSVIEVSEVVADEPAGRDALVLDLRPPAEANDAGTGPEASSPVRTGGRPLRGRVAVVTGGAGGVGRSIALRLVEAGARVCVIGRDLAGLRETVELAGPDAPVLFLQCDVGSVSEIEGVVDFIERFDRPVDVLVHAEAIQVRGGVEHGSVNDLDEQYLVNVRGPYVITQKLLAQLRAGHGHVVFLNSSGAHHPSAELGQFGVASRALQGLADALRDEVGDAGVRVTSVFTEDDVDEPYLSVGPSEVAENVVHALQVAERVEITDLRLRPRRVVTAGEPADRG